MLSAGHARAVLSLDDAEAMQRLADKIVNEDLSVRAAEAAAKNVAAAGTKTAAPRRAPAAPTSTTSAERLGDPLEHQVRITLAAKKRQIIVHFAMIQDLNRILAADRRDGSSARAERSMTRRRRSRIRVTRRPDG